MTNDVLTAFESVVRPDRHIPLHPSGHFAVKEKEAGARLNQVNVDCRGCGEVFAFSLDHRKSGNPVPLSAHLSVAAGARWNKVCDAIFIWFRNESLQVLVCELKSAVPHGSDWKNQLLSSACFVYYLAEIIRRFNPLNVPPIRFYAIAFHTGPRTTGSSKRRTGIAKGSGYPQSDLHTPKKMAVSNNAYVFLNAFCS
jgi:hypothetical protein